jgi:hypothetical protein
MTDLGTEERRLAIEAISTLCHLKKVLSELILKPAGVPEVFYSNLLYSKDASGKTLSKRQIAPLIIDACDKQPKTVMQSGVYSR